MRGQHSPVGASSEKVPIAQRALTNFLELPTVPIGSYVSSPISGLHVLDPRVKQAWLAALLLFPPNGTAEEKVAVSIALALVTAAALPNRVYLPQLTAVVGLCAILFVFTILGADSIMPVIQTRRASSCGGRPSCVTRAGASISLRASTPWTASGHPKRSEPCRELILPDFHCLTVSSSNYVHNNT